MFLGPINHHLPQFLDIPGGDRLGVGQCGGEHLRDTDLTSVDVGVRGDDRPSSVVHSLTHHVLTE